MKNKDYSVNLVDFQLRTPTFKAFYFILEKLDVIHEMLTNNQSSKFKHSYLGVCPDENKTFFEIQKTLSSIINLLSLAKSQQKYPKSSSIPKLNNYNDDIMDQIQISMQQKNNNNLFQPPLYDMNQPKNPMQNIDYSNFSQNNIDQSHLSKSLFMPSNPYDSIQNSNLNQSQHINYKKKSLTKVVNRSNICKSEITAIAGLANKYFVIGSNNGELIYCLLSSNQPMNIIAVCTKKIHKDSVSYICAVNSNTIASLSKSGELIVLNLISNNFNYLFKSQVHSGTGNKVIKYNDNSVITCGNDGSIKLINYQIQNIKLITRTNGDISSIIKLDKIGNNILVSNNVLKRSLYFWNLDDYKILNTLPNCYTMFPDGLVEISSGYIAVANCISPFSIIIVDVFKYNVYKEVKVPQMQMNKCLYSIGNDFCCILDKMYFQISATSFTFEIKYPDKNIKRKGGFIVLDDGKYIGIPNFSNGIDVYRVN